MKIWAAKTFHDYYRGNAQMIKIKVYSYIKLILYNEIYKFIKYWGILKGFKTLKINLY